MSQNAENNIVTLYETFQSDITRKYYECCLRKAVTPPDITALKFESHKFLGKLLIDIGAALKERDYSEESISKIASQIAMLGSLDTAVVLKLLRSRESPAIRKNDGIGMLHSQRKLTPKFVVNFYGSMAPTSSAVRATVREFETKTRAENV